jgi:hypothetical protein
MLLGVNPDHPWFDKLSALGAETLAQCATPRERELVWQALGDGYMIGVDYVLDATNSYGFEPDYDDEGNVVIVSPFSRFVPAGEGQPAEVLS